MPFCCAIAHDDRLDGDALVRSVGWHVLRMGGSPIRVTSEGFLALALSHDVLGRPQHAAYRGRVGVGVVRLDNRLELASGIPDLAVTASDLELAVAVLARHGADALRYILGDFALVSWDPQRRRLLAARDALGVKPLFYATGPHYTLVSDRLRLVGDLRHPDREFIADFLVAGGNPASTHTVWANARIVPPGGLLEVEAGRTTQRVYWSAHEFLPRPGGSEDEQVEEFRHRFDTAVRRRSADPSGVWAELSGGTDSSSIVATAQANRASAAGLGGTITLVDELGCGDERRYSDLVVQRFDLNNELVLNPWPWQTDADGAPHTDDPRVMYPYYARDRQMCAAIRGHGGRVLLSGLGADHYLSGSRLYLADCLVRGRVAQAVRGMLAWAMHDRLSFWTTVRKEAVCPFVPRRVRAMWLPPEERPPAWITPEFARELDLIPRLNLADNPMGRPGDYFGRTIADGLQALPRWLPIGPFQDELEVRYPFLDRELLEFSLRLPAECRVRPGAPKWILRAAMRGRLPEEVRTRRGKAHIGARAVWALRQERSQLETLIRDPILGQLGCIDPSRLRVALEAAWQGHVPNTVLLLSTLALEMWLAVSYNRWATVTSRNPRAKPARNRMLRPSRR